MFILFPIVLPCRFRTRIPLSYTYPTWPLFLLQGSGMSQCRSSFFPPFLHFRKTPSQHTDPLAALPNVQTTPLLTCPLSSILWQVSQTSGAQRGVLLALQHTGKCDYCMNCIFMHLTYSPPELSFPVRIALWICISGLGGNQHKIQCIGWGWE